MALECAGNACTAAIWSLDFIQWQGKPSHSASVPRATYGIRDFVLRQCALASGFKPKLQKFTESTKRVAFSTAHLSCFSHWSWVVILGKIPREIYAARRAVWFWNITIFWHARGGDEGMYSQLHKACLGTTQSFAPHTHTHTHHVSSARQQV